MRRNAERSVPPTRATGSTSAAGLVVDDGAVDVCDADPGFPVSVSIETGLRRTVRWYLHNREWVSLVRSGEYRKWIGQNYAARGRA